MAQLNQEVRRIITVTDYAGAGVTGLVAGNFTFALKRHDPSDDTYDVSAETVSITEIGSGQYWVHFTPTAAAVLYVLAITPPTDNIVGPGELQIDVGSGFAASGGPYLTTRANVQTAHDQGATWKSAQIDQLLASVTDFAQSYCNRQFFSATYTEYPRVRGALAETLNLDVYPVTSITSIHVSTALPRVYATDELLVDGTDYIVEEGNGILHRVGGACWPMAVKAIKAVYVAGYATIPADLERAAIETISAKLFKGIGGLYHLTGESRGEGVLTGIRFDDVPVNTRVVYDMYRDRGIG